MCLLNTLSGNVVDGELLQLCEQLINGCCWLGVEIFIFEFLLSTQEGSDIEHWLEEVEWVQSLHE